MLDIVLGEARPAWSCSAMETHSMNLSQQFYADINASESLELFGYESAERWRLFTHHVPQHLVTPLSDFTLVFQFVAELLLFLNTSTIQ